MAKMIQIRNVPDSLHHKLKARAAAARMSLSDYLLGEMRLLAERPTREELMARLSKPVRPDLKPSPARVVRAERDAR
jgi:plasmid stability protein